MVVCGISISPATSLFFEWVRPFFKAVPTKKGDLLFREWCTSVLRDDDDADVVHARISVLRGIDLTKG